MKEIMVIETNFSAAQIRKMKDADICKDYGFDGGYLYFTIVEKDKARAMAILGKSILDIRKLK